MEVETQFKSELKSQFKTVKKTDPDYEKLMNGTFSDLHRSIPLKPLNNQLNWEMITFEVIPVEKIKKPHFFHLIYEIVKPQHFLVILVPVLFSILNVYRAFGLLFEESSFVFASVNLFITLFLLSAFINIQRTLSEHFQHTVLFASAPASTSLLSKGWVSAQKLKYLSNVILFLTFVFSIPFFLKSPILISLITMLSGLLILSIHRQRDYKYSHYVSAFSHFMLSGPLLAVGSCIALFSFSNVTLSAQGIWDFINNGSNLKAIFNVLMFGISWGMWISLWRQLKTFSELFNFSHGKNIRFITVMGFDKSISFLNKSIISIPLLATCILALVSNGWLFSLATAIVHSFFISRELQLLNKMQSSLSSDAEELALVAQKHHYILAIVQIALMMV